MDELHAHWGRVIYWLSLFTIALILVVGIANDAH